MPLMDVEMVYSIDAAQWEFGLIENNRIRENNVIVRRGGRVVFRKTQVGSNQFSFR
jgi:hypothetical protein